MFSIYKIPTFHLEERMINFERERECFVGLYQYYEFMVGTFPGIFSVDVWWILIYFLHVFSSQLVRWGRLTGCSSPSSRTSAHRCRSNCLLALSQSELHTFCIQLHLLYAFVHGREYVASKLAYRRCHSSVLYIVYIHCTLYSVQHVII